MNIIIETYYPWMIVVIAILAIYWAVRIRNNKAMLRCPQCKQMFGKESTDRITPYFKNKILDGPILWPDACARPGQDGFSIHCDNCGIEVVYDNKNNPMKI